MKSSGGSSTNIRVEKFETADHMIFCVWQGFEHWQRLTSLSDERFDLERCANPLVLPPTGLTNSNIAEETSNWRHHAAR